MKLKKSIPIVFILLIICFGFCDSALASPVNVILSASSSVPTKFPTAQILLYACIFSALLFILCLIHISNSRDKGKKKENKGAYIAGVILILAAALIARIVLSLIFFGHKTDINCFIYWGKRLVSDGAKHFYDKWCDYPPGYMLILGLMSRINDLFTKLFGAESADLNSILIKLPAMLADIGCAYLTYHFAKKVMNRSAALMLMTVVAFTPVMAYVSGAWGQIDQVLALTLLVPILLLYCRKPILAGLVYGIGIIMKPQALMCGPLFAAAYFAYVISGWPHGNDVPVSAFDRFFKINTTGEKGLKWYNVLIRLAQTILAVVAAEHVILLIAIPFSGEQPWYWLLQKYYGTATSYDYATVNAYNFWALIGANWKSTATPFLGLTYGKWGTIFMAASVIGSIILFVISVIFRKNSKGPLPLIMSYMLTAIFMFGHFMHERYIFPAFILLIFAYIYYNDIRLLITYFGFVTTIFINCLAAFYYSALFEYHLYWDEKLILGCSIANMVLFLWFTFVTLDLVLRGKPWRSFKK
jgi:Gpi18-like mannosyltransferase